MLTSLRARVLLMVALFGLLTAGSLAVVMHQAVRAYYADLMYQQAGAFLDRVIEITPDLWMRYEEDKPAISSYLRRVSLYSQNSGLYLLDNEGRVLASSGETKPYWDTFRVNVKSIHASMSAGSRQPFFADDPDQPGMRCVVAARSFKVNGEMRGWLYVVDRSANLGDYMPELLRFYALQTAVKVALLVLAIGVLLTMGMLAILTRPIVGLTRVAEQVKQSGFQQELRAELFPHCERNDEVGRLSRTFRDMFERLKLETQRVSRTDSMRREMVANVSHDLRTPLTALMGQLETVRMKSDTLDASEQADLVDRALNNAHHMRRLTDSLAELAKLDNPEFNAQREPIALGELADDVVQRHATIANDKGIILKAEYPDHLPLAEVDAGLIERAITNLLDNALRITPAGGSVTVQVGSDSTSVSIEVADTGPGVAPADQARVFDRFYQTEAHRDLRGSSGLGLAIVRRVAELHGGSVTLNSAPGRGAQFRLTVPLRMTSAN